MKAKHKETKIVGIIISLMLVFLCALNVTYAFFSTQHSVQGTGEFNFLYVYWISGDNELDSDSEIVITPSTTQIARGETFTLSKDGSELNLHIQSEGVDCYVRLWVNAYLTDDTTTNYGKYFELLVDDATAGDLTKVEKAENSIYFVTNKLTQENSAFSVRVANKMKLSNSAPTEMLGKTFTLTIEFEAVQADNEAFKSQFDDEKGYLSSWS